MVDYKPVMVGIVVTVLLGSIIIFTTFFGFFVKIILGTLAIIIGGFVAAYITDGGNVDGGVNGAQSGIVGGALLGLLLLMITFHDFTFFTIVTGLIVGGIMFGFNFGTLGAVIGNIIKKRSSISHGINNGYLVCNECGSYYKLKEGELPEDYDDECDCGGKIEYKKSNKPFKLILDYKIFGVGVILCVIGGIMLTLVFQLQLNYLLKISVVILGFGILATCASIFNS